MNGIIHPCCHPEDSENPENEDEMYRNIFEYIDRIVSICRPRKLLYMAIDGVAPRAKMNQQRARRFKAASDAELEETKYFELKAQFDSEGRVCPPQKVQWDSNVITPGTPFMHRLAAALQYYVQERMASNAGWASIKVLLSDANNPGEGEHKIMQFIRTQRAQEDHDPNLRHCLHGADADLIMLGLASHEAQFWIMREVVTDSGPVKRCRICGREGHYSDECTGLPTKEEEAAIEEEKVRKQTAIASASAGFKKSWKPLQFLHLNVLREYLAQTFQFSEDALPFKYDFERCIDDFIFMCFFVGNDFLPHMPSLSIHAGSIDQMVLLYQNVLPKLGDYLTLEGSVIGSSTARFVKYLGDVEDAVFADQRKRKNRMKEKEEHEKRQLEKKKKKKKKKYSALI
eukprot:Selendium_serpulae@DN2981_c0_g1_i1.p1